MFLTALVGQKVDLVGSQLGLRKSFERLHESISLLICLFHTLLHFDERVCGVGLSRFEHCCLLSDVLGWHVHAHAPVGALNARKYLAADVRLLRVENAEVLVALQSSIGGVALTFMPHLTTRLCTRLPILNHGWAHSWRGLSSASRLLALVLRRALLPFADTTWPKLLLTHPKLLVHLLVMVLILSVDKVLHSIFQRAFLASMILITWVSTVVFPAWDFFYCSGILNVPYCEVPLRLVHNVSILL